MRTRPSPARSSRRWHRRGARRSPPATPRTPTSARTARSSPATSTRRGPALLTDGDLATARAATRFLLEQQQLPDGSMPRNSLVNGKTAPDSFNTQLDEVAYPILMVLQSGLAGDATLWPHVQAAANYLIAHGRRSGRALGGAERLLALDDRRRDRRARRRRRQSPSARRPGRCADLARHRRPVPALDQGLGGHDQRPAVQRSRTSSGCPRPATRTPRSPTTSATAARRSTSVR